MTEIRRKLYKRGSSFETTIPMPILFAVDKTKKNNIIFKYDAETNRWYIEIEETGKNYEKASQKRGKSAKK